MKRFEFRLETALRLRSLAAETERASLQRLLSERERLERSLASMLAERTEATRFSVVDQKTAGDLRALSSYVLGWKARLEHLTREIANKQGEIAVQSVEVRNAEQAKLALEKMREKQFSAWAREMEQHVETSAQELWLYSHTTKNRGHPR